MRLAHVSDTHVADSRRPEDTRRVLEAFVSTARDAEADLIVHTGDFFDAESSESERALVRDFLVAAAEVAPVVGIRGNHDAALDSGLFSRMRTSYPVRLYDRPMLDSAPLIFVCSTPALRRAHATPDVPGFGVIPIPWFTRAGVAAQLPASMPSDAITIAVNELAAQLLVSARAEAEKLRAAGAIPILLHHGTIVGARYSSGFVPRGGGVEYTAEQFRAVGAEYVALGHYHASQETFDGRVAYAGSTERMNFGEPEAKGFRLVTFEGGRFVRNEFIDLPARRIELIEVNLIGDPSPLTGGIFPVLDLDSVEPQHVKDALVRFRYHVRAQDLHLVDEAAIRRSLVDAGAHEVKVEAVVEQQARVRCEAIITATSLFEEFLAWSEASGKAFIREEIERLRTRLSSIESAEAAREAA